MKTRIFILFYLLIISFFCFSQNNPNGFQFFKFTSLSGEIKTRGQYREYKLVNNIWTYSQNNLYFMGGAFLKTKSFFLHPDFLTVDVNVGYYPETNRNNYIIIFPNQAEVRTTKKLDIRTTLLSKKKIKLSSFTNLAETYQSRENLTNVKTNSKQWGGAIFYGNKFLPISVDFRKGQWEQKEIATTPRTFSMDERALQCMANKSFTARDMNELSYLHNEYVSVFENLSRIANTVDNINLNNNIYFDEKRKYYFNSIISNFNQQGNTNFKRFQALENLTLKLPKNIILSNSYRLNMSQQELNKINQQGIQSSLDHKLYQNLSSRLFFEYNQTHHTAYKEYNNKTGIDIKYTKKIPAEGRLFLSYTYFRGHEVMNSDPVSLQIKNDEYTLSDAQIVLLKRPYINAQSVIVKDITGTIIYLQGIDYILVDRNPYWEIRRVPGGMIANNAVVYVDYTAIQPGAYKYDTDNRAFVANILLFKHMIEVYYRRSSQDNKNLNRTEYLILNYFTQNVVGSRLDFGFINGGAEYEEYKSNIIPYRMERYFINTQKEYNKRLSLSLSGNRQDYQMLNENEKRQYSDVTGRISYAFLKQTQTRINLDLMYRNQKGSGINLDLYTAKSEITSAIRQLYLTFGLEVYKLNYVGDKIKFKGTYISITRKF